MQGLGGPHRMRRSTVAFGVLYLLAGGTAGALLSLILRIVHAVTTTAHA